MKLCLIGNSHMSKTYSLLTERKSSELDVLPTFFLERAVGTTALKIQGAGEADVVSFEDVLLTRSRILKCSDYDAFVVFGMGFSLVSIAELWSSYRPYGHDREGSAEHLVSHEFFEHAARSLLHESKALRILRTIKSRSSQPVVLVPQPLPMEWAANGTFARTEVFKSLVQSGLKGYLLDIYRGAMDEARAEGIRVIDQPPATLSSDFFTLSAFGLADPEDASEGSLFSRGDFFHANERFAELTLKSLSKVWLQ
jgi:hypothetical protein